MTRSLLALLVALAAPSLALAQAPVPGMLPYCPPGQAQGWAPPGHPALVEHPCNPYEPGFVPPIYVPAPVDPVALLPLEIGKAYRDPYGLVWEVVGVQGDSAVGGSAFSVPYGWLIILHYQSIDDWREGRIAGVFGRERYAPRGLKWEVER